MERAIVLFDADCGFCSWSVNKLLAWDRLGGREPQLRAVAIQSREGTEWTADLPHDVRFASWHLVDPAGRRRISSGDAIAPALSLLPFGAIPAFFARLSPALTRWAYVKVTEHRMELGEMIGVAACTVPQPPESVPTA